MKFLLKWVKLLTSPMIKLASNINDSLTIPMVSEIKSQVTYNLQIKKPQLYNELIDEIGEELFEDLNWNFFNDTVPIMFAKLYEYETTFFL